MTRNNPANSRDRIALETSSWFAVVRAYEECARRYARMLEHFELSTSQFDALLAVERLGRDAMPKSIAERLLVTRPNVTGLLRRLEERGLIHMAPHASDGRALLCRLTPAGRRCVHAAQEAAERFVHTQAAPFSNEELRDLEELMRSMHRHLMTMDPDDLALGKGDGSHNANDRAEPGIGTGSSGRSGS